jgi:CheY-like chemotaxis protein
MLALQGGRIQVESEPGKGSTFMVEIAYELVKESDNPGSVNATVESRQLPYSMKVLVVDDNAMNRELAAFILRDLGVKYSLATGGEEALSLLMRESFDVILMDYQMPGMDGKETTKRIREELKLETPIVALSAYAQEQEKQNCLEAGMDAYLTKPVKEEELFNTLEMFAPVTNQAIVNLAHLERMSKGNPEFIDTVILKVADTLPLEIEELRNAVIDGDKQKVNMIAHNMKTTFAVLGVAELAGEALRYLESWEPTTGNIINAAKKLELIEDVGAQVTFQILDTFSDHRRKGESLLS